MNDISNVELALTDNDRAILDALQRGIPAVEHPFAVIGRELGLSEQAVISETARLKRAGYIRRIGAFFSSKHLGYQGSLIALAVDEKRLEDIARAVNSFPGVTHNYQREGSYQLWFTLLTLRDEEKKQILRTVAGLAGVETIIELPSEKTYKIRVTLPMEDGQNSFVPKKEIGQQGRFSQPTESGNALNDLDPTDKKLIHLLSEELPIEESPFASAAEKLDIPLGQVLERIKKYLASGVMRRLGIVLAHRRAGYTANGLCAWQVSPSQVDDVGMAIAAEERSVSHCYRRRADEERGWPYVLYTMIHGHSREEVEGIADSMAERYAGLGERVMLYSVREWKKESLTYF